MKVNACVYVQYEHTYPTVSSTSLPKDGSLLVAASNWSTKALN